VNSWLTFPVAIGFLLLMVVMAFALPSINEPDIWWHLRNGQQIVTTHSLPRFDHYSFTATGSPWLDHEWLSEIFYYLAYRAWGLRGIVALYSALTLLIFEALYYLCCREGANPKTASFVAMFGILLGSVSFGPRPLLFGWLFMLALFLILQRYAASRSRVIWILPPMFALWINFHGSWLFGMIVLGVFIASGFIAGEWGLVYSERFTVAEFKTLLSVAATSVVALFLNPFFYRLPWYPFDLMFRQKSNMNNIDEWGSVDFHEIRGKFVMVLLFSIIGGAMLSRRRWKLNETVLGAFALYVALMYWRMQFFAALVFVPLLATRIRLFPPYDVQKEKPFLNALIIALVLAAAVIWFPKQAALEQSLREKYPVAALQFMHGRGISDHVFADYGWGGYMVWHAPEIKTFIDGRADIFVYNGVFDDYLKIVRLQKTVELFDHYRIRYALLSNPGPVAYFFAHNSCWREIYSDKLAVLFERNEAQPACALTGK
jgi:hypothetical protein